MYKFYCDTFQLHLAAQHRSVAPECNEITEEMAAAAALAASDVRDNRRAPRTKAEVEAEVKRLLAPAEERATCVYARDASGKMTVSPLPPVVRVETRKGALYRVIIDGAAVRGATNVLTEQDIDGRSVVVLKMHARMETVEAAS